VTYIQKLQKRLRHYRGNLAAAPEALDILTKMSKYTGHGMATPHMVVSENGEIWIEFFSPKRRLGIVLDPNPAESSWFLILTPSLTADNGWVKDTPNFDDIVRRFLEDPP